MTLATGSRLGPYEVQERIGKGGMGEVYRAKDTRLGRTVAVKVISKDLSEKTHSGERFEREARAISTLSHPNICALFDVGRQEGIEYLVMEYLEGETLAQRLERGPLSQEELLPCAMQIAEALDKAHRQGIIHRDLKPGNIMLTKAGAKLLDFGLAKLRGVQSGGSLLDSAARTVDGTITLEEMIVGTLQYMPPEQLEGKEADARTDIFAFGTVLYEMATGKKAFDGPTQASIIAAVMSSRPRSASSIRNALPPMLDRLIHKCLAKDPDDRWQNAHDLASALAWIADGGSDIGPAGSPKESKTLGLLQLSTAALLALTLVLGAVLIYQNTRSADPPSLFKLSVVPSPQTRAEGPLALSPDGRELVFAATDRQGQKMLWLRELDTLEAEPLAGTEDGDHPFWSADGRYLGFFTQGKLKRMELSGGPPQILADVSNQKGGAWNQAGVILFAPTFTGGLYKISPNGGPAEPWTRPDPSRSESSHRWPYFLPDGNHFLYTILSAQRENQGIFVGSLSDPSLKKQLLVDFSRAEYAAPGHLLFLRGGTLMAQTFDAAGLELKGEAISLGEKSGYAAYPGYGAFSVSPNGVLAFGNLETINKQLTWFDRYGKKLDTVGEPADYSEPSFSPDQKRLVLDRIDSALGNNNLWVVELARGTVSRFSFGPSNEMSPLWTPDSSRIIFCANPNGPINIYQKPVSGEGDPELLVDTPHPKYPNDLSLDGHWLLFEQTESKTKFNLWYASLSGDRKPNIFLQTPYNESHGRFSPDGKWVAYTSDESGRAEIYVRRFPPTTDGKARISTNGGDQVQWRRDGEELYYLSPDQKLMVVSIHRGTSLEAGIPSPLFSIDVVPNTLVDYRNQYLAAADGRRFLVAASLRESTGAPITVILNWQAILRD